MIPVPWKLCARISAGNPAFRMWAVKNSQKRRLARSEGEKSIGGDALRAGGEGAGGRLPRYWFMKDVMFHIREACCLRAAHRQHCFVRPLDRATVRHSNPQRPGSTNEDLRTLDPPRRQALT